MRSITAAAIRSPPNTDPHLLNSRFVVITTDCLSYASAKTWKSSLAPSASSGRNPGSRRPARQGRPPRRVQGRRRGGPPLGRGRGAPVHQGVRARARRRPRVRGRRLLEVPLRQAGDGLPRPRPEAEVERRLRATRRDQRGRQRARQEAGGRGAPALRPGRAPAQADAQGLRSPARDKDAREEGARAPAPATRGDAREGHAVSVNLFFTSFAKQARRSRKGGFTGCANVFSPIPVTA